MTRCGAQTRSGSRCRRRVTEDGARCRWHPRPLLPSLGAQVCEWIETNLVHGEGEFVGRPFLLDMWQRLFVWRLYEFDPRTRRRIVEEALLELAKGNGKTPLAAAVMLVELAGPSVPVGIDPETGDGIGTLRASPNIPIAAGSYDQADNLFAQVRLMINGGPLKPFFNVFDKEIQFADGRPGKMYRVAASGGTLDGALPSAWAADELHEWATAAQQKTYHVLDQNGAKRNAQGGFCLKLVLSTPGWDKDSLLGKMHAYGEAVERGDIDDPSFLTIHHSADPKHDLDDPAQLRAALAEAYPASWVDAEKLARRYERGDAMLEGDDDGRIPEHRFRRYFLAQWVSAPRLWQAAKEWPELAGTRDVAGLPVVLGFDGSASRDSSVLYGWAIPPDEPVFGFLVGAWERPPRAKRWLVPRDEVDAAVYKAFADMDVQLMVCDPYGWTAEIAGWVDVFGEERVIEFPTASAARMGPACDRFSEAVLNRDVRHDGDPVVARHLLHCVTKETRYGVTIHKDSSDSPRKIDGAVAAVIGYFEASTLTPRVEPSIMFA